MIAVIVDVALAHSSSGDKPDFVTPALATLVEALDETGVLVDVHSATTTPTQVLLAVEIATDEESAERAVEHGIQVVRRAIQSTAEAQGGEFRIDPSAAVVTGRPVPSSGSD